MTPLSYPTVIGTIISTLVLTPLTFAGLLETRSTVPDLGFFNPLAQDGGSMLDKVPETTPLGLGEPLNVIISAKSHPDILVDDHNTTSGALWTYFQSLDFGNSCRGINIGATQSANLGDGNGFVNQTIVMRYNYKDPVLGTCNETIFGGNHFRYWQQTGALANSNAVFMAVSYQLPLAQNHSIVPDGYNLGRDLLVGNATQTTFAQPNPLANAPPSSSPSTVAGAVYIGTTSANNFAYETTATFMTGLLAATSVGVNHNESVPVDGRPALDELVAVLVVNITGRPVSSKPSTINAGPSFRIPIGLSSFALVSSHFAFLRLNSRN